jgi:membrane protein DedA with SNARE-associated domain
MEPAAVAPGPGAPVARAKLAILLSLIGALIVASNVGTILSAHLAQDQPATLLALSARNRHLLLAVAAGIGLVPYTVIAFLRLLVPAVAFYVLGTDYGDRGLAWLERQAGGRRPASIRWVEHWFARAALPLVFLMPGSNLVCLLAGARRMARRTYAIVLAAGILSRLAFFWVLGKALQKPLQVVLDWLTRYQWWIAGAFLAVTLIQSFRQASTAATGAPPVPSSEQGDPGPERDTVGP